MSNQITHVVNPNPQDPNKTLASGMITCVTNADRYQQAEVEVYGAGSNRPDASGTFVGNGENNQTINLRPDLNYGVLSYQNLTQPVTIKITMSHGPSETGPFTPYPVADINVAAVSNAQDQEYFTFSGEDSVDGDSNDIIVRCIAVVV